MEVAEKSKPTPVCGFCRRGDEAEDICGVLYTSDICNAHLRCMQYSALLVQYRAKTFGGFKKNKVLDEIKRGRALACSICKSRKKKPKFPFTGASCGCAISTCRRTYHYYCACTDEGTKCYRIEVRDKATNKTSVQYRIFCSDEHHRKYEKDLKDMELSYDGESSNSGSSEDSSAEDEKGTSSRKSVKSKSRKRKMSEISSASEVEINDKKPEKKKVETPKSKSKNNSAPETPVKQNKEEVEAATNQCEEENTAVRLGERNLDSSNSPDGSVQQSPSNTNTAAEAYLCILEAPDLADKVVDRVRNIVANQYNVFEPVINFWSLPSQSLMGEEHMMYFMKDIAVYVYESDLQSLARVVTNPSVADVDKYNHNVRFNEDYLDSELMDKVHSKLRDAIGTFFGDKHDETGTDHGAAFLFADLKTMFIVLPLNQAIDPMGTIRDHLKQPCEIFSLGPHTKLLDPKKTKLTHAQLEAQAMEEFETLFTWLKRNTGESDKIKIRPKEIILREKSMSSATCRICTQLQMHYNQSNMAPASIVMFVVPVNEQIMAYGQYCLAALTAFVEEDLTPMNPVYCVLDLNSIGDVFSLSDVIPALPDSVSLEIFSGLDPKVCPITTLVMRISIRQ